MKEKLKTARLESKVIDLMRSFFQKEGFIELFPPKIVRASGACENIDTLFEVAVDGNFHWFHSKNPHKVYLSQTAQLYLEAFTPYLKKVFAVGPSFRAEPRVDNRHLTEFTMFEIEFLGGFRKLLDYIERAIYYVVKGILKLPKKVKLSLGIGRLNEKRLKKIKIPFPRVTYNKAIKILGLEWGADIHSKDEQRLVKLFGEQPVFITHFPNPLFDHGKEIEVEKFFNMIPDPKNSKYVLSADLILPIGGEAVGAAQRVWKFKELKWRLKNSKMLQRLIRKGGGIEDFSWYLERVKEKSKPHSGCGFGIGRILKFLKGEENIAKVVTFPANRANVI